MARDEAYREAEKKIETARRTGAKILDLSALYDAKDNEKLTKLPESLSQLTELQSLILANNQLTALPESLGQLTQLQLLNLSTNQLTELPESLGQLTRLTELNVENNQLTTLPESLSRLTELQSLHLFINQLTELPESLGQLTRLTKLNVEKNQLTTLPESLNRLTRLQSLHLSNNQLEALPESLGELTQLKDLHLFANQLRALPGSLGKLVNLELLRLGTVDGGNPLLEVPQIVWQLKNLLRLTASNCQLTSIPDWIGEMKKLRVLYATQNKITKLPSSLGQLKFLEILGLTDNLISELPNSVGFLKRLGLLELSGNPLESELAAARKEGVEAVKRYLRAKAAEQVVLNEAKLILIGEGEVGKSCLLGALRGEPWEEGRETTHGIEIKPVKVTDTASGTEITMNGWDFGGQRVYRPTHQLFFSSPAVYLVVWKPREGPQQGFVKEWIKLVKHREPDAKILVVATHGGPGARQPDIDRQEIWDLFGKETVIDFFFVDSKPDAKGKCDGIDTLKKKIAEVAASLPEVGRKVAKSWHDARVALKELGCAYIPIGRAIETCGRYKMSEADAKLFLTIEHRLGHLIHYAHDPLLKDLVILKPDWLATALSFVLDDKRTRDAHGLVSHDCLSQLWNDSRRPEEFRYPAELHPVFLKLMERYDICYRVAEAKGDGKDGTSLIAQLVPDVKPNPVLGWADALSESDEERVQICRIVEDKTGHSAAAEGLFFQLIVRLHKYSLGRISHEESSHWQRGLVLDDDYNGRALMEHIGNDVKITVRAVYPEAFLSVLTHEVKWLVENFWKGLRCDVMVPCIEPCGRKAPGTGLFEVEKLIKSKRHKRPDYPCPICSEWQEIDCLLRNAPAATRTVPAEVLGGVEDLKRQICGVRVQLNALQGITVGGFEKLDATVRRGLSEIDDTYTQIMQMLLDESKDGPRLFTLEPVEPGLFSLPTWINQKFRLTLWCEHSRLPLPLLNPAGDKSGEFEFDVTAAWLVTVAPYAKMIANTLSLVLPVASVLTKVKVSEEAYKMWEKRLESAKKAAESVAKVSEKLTDSRTPKLDETPLDSAHGAELRRLHAFLKEKDAGFGGLVRVQNRRQEFLWVHPQFEKEY